MPKPCSGASSFRILKANPDSRQHDSSNSPCTGGARSRGLGTRSCEPLWWLEAAHFLRKELREANRRRIFQTWPDNLEPTGSPLRLRPTGAVVAGQPVNVAGAM